MSMTANARLRRVAVATTFAALSLLLGGASCDKKSVANPADLGPSVPFEPPPGGKKAAATKPAETKPAEAKPAGTKASEAKAAEAKVAEAVKAAEPTASDPQARFAALAEKLPSPCGKAESLKRTLEGAGCKSAPFAKKFVA